LVIIGLPELFRGFADARMFVFGAAIIAMMIFRHQGILPARQRTYNLQGLSAAAAQATDSGGGLAVGQPVARNGVPALDPPEHSRGVHATEEKS
jgi:hypothetical protein